MFGHSTNTASSFSILIAAFIQKRGLMMKDFGRWGVVVFFSTIYLAICPSPKGFAHDNPQAYIVVGESTDLGIGATVPDKAWVSMFHQFLEKKYFNSAADLHNHSVFGATMGDIRRDQLAPALSDIASHNPVVLSLGGGGNDLLKFIASPEAVTCLMAGIQCVARLNALLNNVEALLDNMVGSLRAAAPNTPILLRTEYNPLLKKSCGGPTDALAQLADLVIEGGDVPFLTSGLNDRIRDVAAKYDAQVIEIFQLFVDNDPNKLVADDCIHATDAGHKIIFKAALDAFGAFLMQ